jgi:hypothetical protein
MFTNRLMREHRWLRLRPKRAAVSLGLLSSGARLMYS